MQRKLKLELVRLELLVGVAAHALCEVFEP
jgi:hypothetical protein